MVDQSLLPAARAATRLVLDALAVRTGAGARGGEPERVGESDAWLVSGVLGDASLTVAVLFVAPPAGSSRWHEAKRELETRLSARQPGFFLLWAPAGADLPAREPHTSEFIRRTEEVAARLAPGGHGEARFPATLLLRKSDDEGSYVTARGGLASVWARFTGRVSGHYQLDSNELHRLPAGEGYVTALIDEITAIAATLSLGESKAIETDDAWTVQRLSEGEGFVILGEAPGDEVSSGAILRRNLRRTMQALRPALIARPADLRVLAVVGPYPSFEEQPVGTALLGFDPTLFGGIDQVLLAADGQVGPLLNLTHSPLLADGAGDESPT